MSFSDTVKAELFEKMPTQSCCKASELAAILLFASHMDEQGHLYVRSRNKAWDEYLIELSEHRLHYFEKMLVPISLSTEKALLSELFVTEPIFKKQPSPELLKGSCCYRAFVKGAFLGAGTVSDPATSYRLEVFTGHRNLFSFWCEILDEFALDYHESVRNGKYVSYFQDSEAISDFLSIIGAHRNMMDFENVKIEKMIKNDSNRRSNCEEANLDKQSKAAAVQLAAVEKINRLTGFQNLRPELEQIARARLEDPGCSLTELGKMVEPPIGKSAVYGRLQKLIEIAQTLEE